MMILDSGLLFGPPCIRRARARVCADGEGGDDGCRGADEIASGYRSRASHTATGFTHQWSSEAIGRGYQPTPTTIGRTSSTDNSLYRCQSTQVSIYAIIIVVYWWSFCGEERDIVLHHVPQWAPEKIECNN